jgi:hypothetical protein
VKAALQLQPSKAALQPEPIAPRSVWNNPTVVAPSNAMAAASLPAPTVSAPRAWAAATAPIAPLAPQVTPAISVASSGVSFDERLVASTSESTPDWTTVDKKKKSRKEDRKSAGVPDPGAKGWAGQGSGAHVGSQVAKPKVGERATPKEVTISMSDLINFKALHEVSRRETAERRRRDEEYPTVGMGKPIMAPPSRSFGQGSAPAAARSTADFPSLSGAWPSLGDDHPKAPKRVSLAPTPREALATSKSKSNKAPTKKMTLSLGVVESKKSKSTKMLKKTPIALGGNSLGARTVALVKKRRPDGTVSALCVCVSCVCGGCFRANRLERIYAYA